MPFLDIKEKKSLEVRNKTATEAEIILYGSIGESFWDDSVSAKDFHNELKNLPATVKNISLRINSPGGDVFDGVTIYNRLKAHGASITVYVDGMAASIASIIAMAGDNIIMGEGAQIMIHKPWTMTMGNSQELADTIDRLDDIEEQMVSIYARKTGLGRSEIKNMLSKETWILSEEALDLGFATEIAEDELKMAASWEKDLNKAIWLRKQPKAALTGDLQTKYIQDKLNTLKENIEGVIAR